MMHIDIELGMIMLHWESTESHCGDVVRCGTWNLRRRPSLHQATAVVVPKAADRLEMWSVTFGWEGNIRKLYETVAFFLVEFWSR